VSAVLAQKEIDEAKTGEFAGFFMKPDGLGEIASYLDDDWRKDNLFFIGGSSQAGKTTFCTQMAYEIADDPRNNAICIYHSIDDAKRYPTYKMICNASEGLRLRLNHVSNPNYWMTQEGFNFVREEREKGYKKILQMMEEERLVIEDTSDGQSIKYTEALIKRYRKKYPDKNIVMFLDNFHKLPDHMNLQPAARAKLLCNTLKNLTVREHVTIISTVEYRKLGEHEMPSNAAIAESRAFDYDATIILHLYNNLHHKGEEEATVVHEHDGLILPRIIARFGKNKVSGFEGRLFLDLFGGHGKCRAVDTETAIREMKERKAFLKENDNF
jgi:replicative DNA helicase